MSPEITKMVATAVPEVAVISALTKEKGEATIEGIVYVQSLTAAAPLKIYPSYLNKIAKEGRLDHYRDDRNRIWFKQEDVDTFDAARQAAKAAGTSGRGAGGKSRQLPYGVRRLKWVVGRLTDMPATSTRVEIQELFETELAEAITVYMAKIEKAEAAAEAATETGETVPDAVPAESDEAFEAALAGE